MKGDLHELAVEKGWVKPSLLDLAKAKGGLTIDPHTGEPIENSQGFYVSLPGFESKFDAPLLTESEFNRIVGVYRQLAKSKGDLVFVGVWIDNDWLYFDLSEHIEGKELATVIGKRRGQKAIFDCSTGQSIYL